ncbi:heparinase II/III domain-containing protein [Nocardioides sp. Kera G14]|uniref:heparinase II/III family protein n=1 Tax=Nocardioides sp. Kera G14 TaxID=2884264 RepID=UPI001D1119B9|nr:heparinase II/III family protein [Nocardioides sp. Kera G14]UDY23119.1 heparinase II/III family protein [Nocardioides sp. Kera G14]
MDRVAASIPPLTVQGSGPELLALAEAVTPFYFEEYLAHIDDVAEGRFTFFGQTADFGSPSAVDWHHEVPAESDFHLWRMKLAHMGFVGPMLMAGDDEHLNAVGHLLKSYRESSDFGVSGCFSSYWFPYSVSHRVLAILSAYVVAAEAGRRIPESLRDEIESFLRWNVGFILVNVEHELRNNHVERNLAALCLYFSFAESVPRRIGRRLDREVRRVISACLLPDGLIAERSAMYQGLAVMAADVFSRAPFLSSGTRALAGAMHEKALSAWLTMTHPDGQIALFNDSWFGEVPVAGKIAGGTSARPVSLLPDAGYVRFEADGVFVLMDAGPIGPRWNPGHGHADFLSAEMDVMGQRFLVDPGTYQYSTGPRRAFERSAASHNGPVRDGVEPVDYLGCFRVGRLRDAEILEHVASGSGGMARGRLSLPGGGELRRTVEVSPGLVIVTDEWVGEPSGARVGLTVPGDWQLEHVDAGRAVFDQEGVRAEIRVTEGLIADSTAGEWSCNYLESRGASVLDLRPAEVDDTYGRVVWEVRAGTPADEMRSEDS